MFSRENPFRALLAVLHQARRDAEPLDIGVIIGKYARMPRERGSILRSAAGVIPCYEPERRLQPAIRKLHRDGLRGLYGRCLETCAPARAMVD
jgi:hypothetical protein